MKSRCGFTLLEVIISLGIFSLMALTIYYQVSSTTKSVSYVEDKFIAALVAENSLEEYFSKREWPTIGENEDDINLYGKDWHVKVIVSETDIKDIRNLQANVYVLGQLDRGPVITLERMIGRN